MTQHQRVYSFFIVLWMFLSSAAAAQTATQSPADYLGYKLGEQFTPHYRVLGYFKHVAETSPMVRYQRYGTTNEGRELGIVTVTSKANQGRLEQIRTDNLKRTGLMEGDVEGGEIPIVWLSYNVHGNESSSSEAAMKTLYALVNPQRSDTKEWLKNTVVIMDPMLNPDGRDRYVHWYKETVGEQFNARGNAREHHEPWPGGRTNHYYFDLNRDWAWLTQKESRARLAVYQQWMPQIHVDFHEQGYNEPYYFAPAAKPFHKAITEWQEQFQYTIGKNHARYFDKNNWLYFTREVFDLFYPSYGDTYPIFNGAIGMTYEQGGSGFAGLGIIKAEGDTLTLRDRLIHHHTTGLSTVEVTSRNAEKVVDEFTEYFKSSRMNPSGKYKSYVLKNDGSRNIEALLQLLDQQQIRYGILDESGNYEGFSYQSGREEEVSLNKDDIVINLHQPKAVLARVLLEPNPVLTDSLTYDITAWALPYAYGVPAYAFTESLAMGALPRSAPVQNDFSGEPYAYLCKWNDVADVKFLAALLQNEITVRRAGGPFTIDNRDYTAGTLIITANGNEKLGNKFYERVERIAREHGEQLYAVSSGLVTSGSDFGSDNVSLIEKPRVAVLSGTGTSSGNVGEVWHFFDKQIEYPATLIDTDYFGEIDLDNFDVFILPSAMYGNPISEERLKEIRAWVRSGGTLIALQGANGFLAGKEGFSLKEKSEEEVEENSDPNDQLQTYRRRQRVQAPGSNPGSIFRVTLDNTHPLAFGYADKYFSLKLGSDAYSYLKDGWNVGVTKEDAHRSGFAGYKVLEELENTLTFGVQTLGSGRVVYMIDNPLFRAFWYNGKLLFGNAVFMVGQ